MCCPAIIPLAHADVDTLSKTELKHLGLEHARKLGSGGGGFVFLRPQAGSPDVVVKVSHPASRESVLNECTVLRHIEEVNSGGFALKPKTGAGRGPLAGIEACVASDVDILPGRAVIELRPYFPATPENTASSLGDLGSLGNSKARSTAVVVEATRQLAEASASLLRAGVGVSDLQLMIDRISGQVSFVKLVFSAIGCGLNQIFPNV
jgi:hypothetical protein